MEGRGGSRELRQERRQAQRRLPLFRRDSCTTEGAPHRKNPSPFFSVGAAGPRRKEEGPEGGGGRSRRGEREEYRELGGWVGGWLWMGHSPTRLGSPSA